MSRSVSHPPATLAEDDHEFFLRVEQELAAGYLEVGAEGISIDQLFTIYTLMLRAGIGHALAGLRSVFRMDTAAHS